MNTDSTNISKAAAANPTAVCRCKDISMLPLYGSVYLRSANTMCECAAAGLLGATDHGVLQTYEYCPITWSAPRSARFHSVRTSPKVDSRIERFDAEEEPG